ncbi:MAG: S1 RNA-binding domain-containing protein [Candidatus Aminicenantes bacterium]|nr:S1 RNA-binding domain-containing protein [Candidatus Aminicenantes bacterium]
MEKENEIPNTDTDAELETETDMNTGTDEDIGVETETETDTSTGTDVVNETGAGSSTDDAGETSGIEEEVEEEEEEEEAEEEEFDDDLDDEETIENEEPAEIEDNEEVAGMDKESSTEFSELMKEYDLKSANTETHITGQIIDIIDNKVIVDIGQKTEGILNKEELTDWDGGLTHQIGDSITVVCKNINMKEGYITVSKKQVDAQVGWSKVRHAYDKKTLVKGKLVGITEDNKGFKVDMGVEMFLPISQLDVKKIKSPKNFLGKEFDFKITRINSKEKTGVLSRRVILEEERNQQVKELFESLKEGDHVTGIVTSLTDYGAFVNIGGLDGLIHKDNISYGRVNHPKEKLRKGDEVEAVVLGIDKGSQRVSLGLKQKHEDPWGSIQEKYPVGKKLVAKVTKIVSFGAFIELEEGVEGLLHISDLSWDDKTNSVEEYVAVGEKLWVQVIELKPEEKKIKLGLKQLEMRPEEKYIEKHNVGDVVKGVVKKILKSRVFIGLEKGVEGVVRISDITYYRIDTPEEYMREKEPLEVMILSDSLDSNYKVKLGIKQLSEAEWREFFRSHKNGSMVNVKIKKITDKGIPVEISKNIEGFVRLNEIDEKKLELEEIKSLHKAGDQLEAMVVSTDPEKKRIYLSFKALRKKREREEIDKYSKSESESVTTIGDLFQNALDKRDKKQK